MPERMPSLARVTRPYVCLICKACNRRGRYATARLLARYGDIDMPSLPTLIARERGCPRAIEERVYDRCRVTFDLAAEGRPIPLTLEVIVNRNQLRAARRDLLERLVRAGGTLDWDMAADGFATMLWAWHDDLVSIDVPRRVIITQRGQDALGEGETTPAVVPFSRA